MDNLLLIDNGITKDLSNNIKIASFDLDNTIIKTKSGKLFPKNKDDWILFNNNVKSKLEELVKNNYKIVIFSNQNGIEKNKITREDLLYKCNNIINELNVPILFCMAIYNDIMRKPRIGMWKYMKSSLYNSIDFNNSFYCGDAIGRSNDFSASDFKFSLNIGIKMYSPEELFNDNYEKINYKLIESNFSLNPKSYFMNNKEYNTFDFGTTKREIVIIVGPPASGKSTIYNKYFSNYILINQDILQTIAKCKKTCIEAITNSNENIFIDNTNKNIKTRKIWIDIAKKYNLIIKCIYININKDLSIHVNTFRMLKEEKKVPNIAIHVYYKYFEEPSLEEGINELVKINKLSFDINDNLLIQYLT